MKATRMLATGLQNLALGLKPLESFSYVEQIGEPTVIDGRLATRLRFLLHDVDPGKSTDWYLVVEDLYPFGKVGIYPAVDGGIEETHFHQVFNQKQKKDHPWRTGRICITDPHSNLGKYDTGGEPIDAEHRLGWHVQRAYGWMKSCAKGSLRKMGDHFELPCVPSALNETIMVDECEKTFSCWQSQFGKWGSFEAVSLQHFGWMITKFKSRSGHIIRVSHLTTPTNARSKGGVWWLWEKPIVSKPWRSPVKWSDLAAIAAEQGQDIGKMEEILDYLRKREQRWMVLGFPIPKRVGEANKEIHWWAIKLPDLNKQVKGFRPGFNALKYKGKLCYDNCLNITADRYWARGGFPSTFRDLSFVLVGAGSLGSTIAEFLARAGIQNLSIFDDDILTLGNLVRHTLTANDVTENKAAGLAKRLRLISPHIQVTAHQEKLKPEHLHNKLFDQAHVIIDTTGGSDVLPLLESAGVWRRPKLFFSASVGFKAERQYIFSACGVAYPKDMHDKKMMGWSEREKNLRAEEPMRWEAGCWSPLFPARCDDIYLGAISAIRVIETKINSALSGHFPEPELHVFEQSFDNKGSFLGFNIVPREENE